jgi:hypothetical protein
MRILIDNGHGLETLGKCSPEGPVLGQILEWRYTRELVIRKITSTGGLAFDRPTIRKTPDSVMVPGGVIKRSEVYQ